MNMFLTLAFLFYIGCTLGWVLEFFFRRIVHKKWMNPGFLVGPYLPLYGFGLCSLYLLCLPEISFISSPVLREIIRIVVITLMLTLIEYLAGIIFIKGMKIKLWDYSDRWGNVQGIICPLFSLAWGAIGAGYLLFVHPHILEALIWLSENLAFSFVIGFFFGIFTIDFCYSMHLGTKIRAWAAEHDVVVKYERFKDFVKENAERQKEKISFFIPVRAAKSLKEALDGFLESRYTKIKPKWTWFKKNK